MREARCARFTGRVALVTGAASGIGAATAFRLAEEGASVILSDRDTAGAELVRRGLARTDRHMALHHDVTLEADWQSVLKQLWSRHGRLDVLVNNAGWSLARAIAEMSLEEWRAVMAVHCDSVFLSLKHAVRLLAASGGGAVVNVCSIRAYAARPNTAAYCAAKSAARMLTKAAAMECAAAGNRVRVNSIHPGYVRTGLAAGYPPGRLAEAGAEVPIGRLAEPAEVAAAIAFLASDDAAYMTGSELVVDGGLTAA